MPNLIMYADKLQLLNISNANPEGVAPSSTINTFSQGNCTFLVGYLT
jgi:hypothetical protein